MGNPAFNSNPITETTVEKKHSFFSGMKNVAIQCDVLTERLWKEQVKEWKQGNLIFEGKVCGKNYITSSKAFPASGDQYPILSQQKTIELDTIQSGEEAIVTHAALTYHRELFDNYLEKEIINWWENDVKDKIYNKYGGLNKAPEICQFARQCRNASGHRGVNIDPALKVPDPIWKGINLKNYPWKRLREIFTEADFFDFWIEF